MAFTKKVLIEAATRELASCRRCHEALKGTEYAERVAEACRVFEIALAAMGAEPNYQCEFCHHDENGKLQWHWEDVNKDFYDQYDSARRGQRRIVYTASPAQVSDDTFIPKNLDRALGVVGVALPESKEEFNFQIERYIQRLIDHVIRYSDEFREHPNHDKWISICEQIPERDKEVQLYCMDTDEQFIGYLPEGETENEFVYAQTPGMKVCCSPTHWKPLLATPQE